MRIHITESTQNFSESTVVSSVYAESGRNVRDIYIRHLDELHYVSTAPMTQSVSQQVENWKANNLQEKSNLQISQTKSRTDYMRDYMREKIGTLCVHVSANDAVKRTLEKKSGQNSSREN